MRSAAARIRSLARFMCTPYTGRCLHRILAMPRHLSIRQFAPYAAPLIASLIVAGVRSEQRWLVDLAENDGTSLSVRMTLSIDGDQWQLYSRAGAVNQFINWR